MKLFKTMWVCFFLVLVNTHQGQELADARSLALGMARTVPEDNWPALNNPSGLAGLQGFSLGLSYLNKYIIKEMKDFLFSFHYGFKNQGIGISGSFTGLGTYLEQRYILSYGREFTPWLKAGLGLEYLARSIAEVNSSTHSATFKIGLELAVSELVTVSFSGYNPFGLSISTIKNDKLPSQYAVGVCYVASPGITLLSELESDEDFQPLIRAALEYALQDKFFLRMGAISSPFRITAGVGLHYSHFIVDISTEYHTYLGFCPCVSIVYQQKARKDERN